MILRCTIDIDQFRLVQHYHGASIGEDRGLLKIGSILIYINCAQVASIRDDSNGWQSIAMDIFILSMSDFLVCTFSSNVCRIAYILRLVNKSLVTDLYEVVSLDR
jgi:hypothetical protein